MPINLDTVFADVLANAQMVSIMNQVMPGVSTNPMFQQPQIRNVTLRILARTEVAKIGEAKIHAFIDAVNARGL